MNAYATPDPPAGSIGFPSRDPAFDAAPGFLHPPPGYGEVAFYWWLGDPLTRERLSWQLDRLQDHGVMGLQINYAHSDQGGISFGYTYPSDPPLFSEAWWSLFTWFRQEANKRGMSVSLSDYTLCSPGQGWFTDEVIAAHPELRGAVLESRSRDVQGGDTVVLCDCLSVRAHRLQEGAILPDSGIDLTELSRAGSPVWSVPEGTWRIVWVFAVRNSLSVDPMNPGTGERIVEAFFQRFENRMAQAGAEAAPGKDGAGLNFFFSDELSFGVSGNLWNERFAEEFLIRKGYALLPEIDALFEDIGPRTPKIRLDYRDVMVELEEEGYFRTVFNWHQQRGMIYGCDHGGRGRDVTEFGDYFRTQRWNQGPGNDQPFLQSDIIKNKVASSIAHLYDRPRTWLEGFHSSGWGTSSAQVADAIFRNFVSGHNLLTLHGLYYATHGGWWEWAPPCNHFRMPYWTHMKALMTCSERLSFLLSQGRHCCDVAILYPVAPQEAGMEGDTSIQTAFGLAEHLFDRGMDFDFIDFQSLERAEVAGNELRVTGERYRAVVVPSMKAIRWEAYRKLLALHQAGGLVILQGDLPEASDRIGRNDPDLDRINRTITGTGSPDFPAATDSAQKKNRSISRHTQSAEETFQLIHHAFPRDFACLGTLPDDARTWVMHRRIGARDVYMVYGVPAGSTCFFRSQGTPERWDPWTGNRIPLTDFQTTGDGLLLRTALEPHEPQLIVFDTEQLPNLTRAGEPYENKPLAEVFALSGSWSCELQPTRDNTWGDFRMPPSNSLIGAEVQRFRHAREPVRSNDTDNRLETEWASPQYNDAHWEWQTHGCGPVFLRLGPVPESVTRIGVEQRLAGLAHVEPGMSLNLDDAGYTWQEHPFSWRLGVEGDPGHQGYHGLKEQVTDDFLALGVPEQTWTDTRRHPEGDGGRYYLWTTLQIRQSEQVRVLSGDMKPALAWLNGTPMPPEADTWMLQAGTNRILLAYDQPGRTHFILLSAFADPDWQQPLPLAMRWHGMPGLHHYDCLPAMTAEWFRFQAAPGLKRLRFHAHGDPRCWIGGVEQQVHAHATREDGSRLYEVVCSQPCLDSPCVAFRIPPADGYHGGALLPEPIEQDCGLGRMEPGDWSGIDGLTAYSGGIWYRKTFVVAGDGVANGAGPSGRIELDLGDVVSSAEVLLNGHPIGIRVAPPWRFDVTGQIRPGENLLEVLVCNTLANHYLTIPTRYRGDLKSGLLGPVTLSGLPGPVSLSGLRGLSPYPA